jgi:predicted MFS family arabinose efflux permease
MTRSRKILLSLLAVYVAAGLSTPLFKDLDQMDRVLSFVLGIATMVALYVWCRQDALARGMLAPGRSCLWAALFPPLFLPLYFVRTQGGRAAARMSLKAIGCYVGLWLGAVLGMVIAQLVLSLGR